MCGINTNCCHLPVYFLQSSIPKTILIPIPISKSSAPRFRNSVEGLNQEIERITIQDSTEKNDAIVVSRLTCAGRGLIPLFLWPHSCMCFFLRQPQDVPDGHRAPLPVPPQRSSSTRSIDTQTPSGGGLSGSHSNCSSRPDSISPSYLTVVNDMGGGSPYEDKGDRHPCCTCTKASLSQSVNDADLWPPVCPSCQSWAPTPHCLNMLPLPDQTTATCSRENLQRAVRRSKCLRRACKSIDFFFTKALICSKVKLNY